MNPTDRYYTADDLRQRAALARQADNPGRADTLEAVARAVETYTDNGDPLIFTGRDGEVVTGPELPEGAMVWGTVYIRAGEPVLLVSSAVTTDPQDEWTTEVEGGDDGGG